VAGLTRSAIRMFPCGHTLNLPNDDFLWRRFMATEDLLTWDADLGWLPNPRSNALKMDPELSAYWQQHLARHGAGPTAVLANDSRYTLVGRLPVGETRALRFGVLHSPQGDRSIDCSHSSVEWPVGAVRPPAVEPSPSVRKALKYDLSRVFTFIYGDLPPPPEGATSRRRN
jgi:hypothetical protein